METISFFAKVGQCDLVLWEMIWISETHALMKLHRAGVIEAGTEGSA